MSDNAPAENNHSDRQNIASAILLGVAAILTAYAAYQGALTDGDAGQGYVVATQKLSDANFFFAQGNSVRAADNELFVEYAGAVSEGNVELANYIQTELMSPNLQAAVDWWAEDDEAKTPLDDLEGNPYETVDYEAGQALQEESDKAFAEASDADDKGDQYQVATILFAMTLFLGGITTLFSRPQLGWALLGLGLVTLVFGVIVILGA